MGTVTFSEDTLFNLVLTEDFENESLSVSLSGDWERTTARAKDGDYSYSSKDIGDDESSSTTYEGERIYSVSFDYYVSSEEGFDEFFFNIDDSNEIKDSGDTGWTSYSKDGLADESHDLEWKYEKDGSASQNDDKAYIDNLSITLHEDQRITEFDDLSSVDVVNGATISWTATVPEGASVLVETRCSEDGSTFSDWKEVENGEDVPDLPIFKKGSDVWVQARQTLTLGNDGSSPEIENIQLDVEDRDGAYLSVPQAKFVFIGKSAFVPVFLIPLARSAFYTQRVVPTGHTYVAHVPITGFSVFGLIPVWAWGQHIPKCTVQTTGSDPQLYLLKRISPPLARLGVLSFRPRQYWTPDPAKAQTIYQFVLTGSADGEDDITIPISSCQMRRRDGKPTYMSVNVPNYDDYADEILARTNGEMVLKKGVRFNDGTKQLQEIARVEMEMENLRMDKGPKSRSITLVGHKTVSTTDPNKVTISGVSYRNYSGGLRRYRCEVDLWLKPGDLMVIPEEDEEFEVGYISYTIGPREQRMEIKEAE